MLALSPGSFTQFFVEVRVDKPGVGVVLHQAVDLPLSHQEASGSGLMEALDDSIFGVEIQVYLIKENSYYEPLTSIFLIKNIMCVFQS